MCTSTHCNSLLDLQHAGYINTTRYIKYLNKQQTTKHIKHGCEGSTDGLISVKFKKTKKNKSQLPLKNGYRYFHSHQKCFHFEVHTLHLNDATGK